MIRDVFYYGKKPNVHPRERPASDLADARQQATTEHFWIINAHCDYRGFDWDFDFEFLPDEDVWTANHNNVWPSQHQKDSGTWLCPKEFSDVIIYRGDVEPVVRKNEQTDNWIELDKIDHTKFDFSWHPDPTDPPYIYQWGCKFFPVQIKPVLEYRVHGAVNIKYMGTIAELLPEYDRWVEVQTVDHQRFDFTWRPDPMDPPYIYVWGNKHIDARLQPTLEYHTPNALDRKYMPDLLSVIPEYDKWREIQEVDKTKFDFSWRPDPREPAYIYTWGNKWIDAVLRPTLEYHCTGATERKYMGNDIAVLPERDKWKEIQEVDKTKFDFSWRPDPREPAYIYTWGNKWIDAVLRPTLEYHCENATERKYMTNDVVVLPEKDRWKLVKSIDMASFDFSWRPDPREPNLTYVFGNELYDAVKMPTVLYVMPDSIETKYVTDIRAKLANNPEAFEHLEDAVLADYSWVPDPDSPPYIYAWGNQWNDPRDKISIQYRVEGATEYKYMDDRAVRKPCMDNWNVIGSKKISNFDFSWEPSPKDPPFIYVFGNQWFSAEKEPTIEYRVFGATEKKYINSIVAVLSNDMTHWELQQSIDAGSFDFSWHPDPDSPPYIYQFATLLDDIWVEDGPRYITPNNDGTVVRLENKLILKEDRIYPKYYIETTLDDLVAQHPTEMFWALNKKINYETFDFSWKPEKGDLFNVTVFGSTESVSTHTYFVNATEYLLGNKDFNYVQKDVHLDEKYLASLFVKPGMFYIDSGNTESQSRFTALKERFPDIQKTRYLNSWVDTINRCINKSSTELCWILNSELDYTNFDFDYYPNPWQIKMVHIFGTQWSHWGTTYMVNKNTFAEDTKYIKIIEHLSNLNFVKNRRAVATNVRHDIVYIDHGNLTLEQTIDITGNNHLIVRYEDSYLNTFRNLLKTLPTKKDHHVWIVSSICDYTNFDFTYICDPFASEQLHVFPSSTQKFGDTFLVNVNKLRELIESMEILQDYGKINFNNHLRAKRLPAPVCVTHSDTHVDIDMSNIEFPYAVFVTEDNTNISVTNTDTDDINLWSPADKNIIIASTGASRIIVPKEAMDYVKKELYDYPYIKKSPRLSKSKPIDIVYLSNGETGAEENWEHLLSITKNLPNRVVRVDGVNGRVAAYHAALEASNTPWAFTVFAKLKINPKFDFNWQPDRMQVPKHYIFHAKNPVNGLVYGHQGLICYNKKLTLANNGGEIDFTLADEHEVVPLISGTAHYNTDEFSTWRTAFREAVKLKDQVIRNPNDDTSVERLDVWLNKAEGKFAQYSIKGAVDADEYYNEVNGDFDKLKLSYEWEWLRKRFTKL